MIMKASDVRSLGIDELNQKLSSLKRELLDLRMKAASGKLDKSHRVAELRHDVARILTLLKEKASA